MAFYIDQNKDFHSQWRAYLQNKSYVDDITKLIGDLSKQQARDFSDIISVVSG